MLYTRLLAVVLLSFFPLFSFAQTAKTTQKEIRIMAYGDSLMSGYGVDLKRDFARALHRNLSKRKMSNLWIYNNSVDGSTTENGLDKIEKLIATKPDIVILELGINDIYQLVPLQKTYDNLAKIITRLQQEKIQILLIGINAPASAGAEYVSQFEGMYKYLAKQYGLVLYPDFLDGVENDPSLKLADGIHPNVYGIELMADRVAPLVIKMMQDIWSVRENTIAP